MRRNIPHRLLILLGLGIALINTACEKGEPHLRCQSTHNCMEGHRCIDKLCLELCHTDRDCSNDFACARGLCVKPKCGNGVPEDAEECDDGNGNNDDSCRRDCTLAYCGDLIVGPHEECDDGNPEENDACLSNCRQARCGDGIVHVGVEACDDGNDNDNDTCNNACHLHTCGDGSSCLDCAGVPYGNAQTDACNICDTDPNNDCQQDCMGIWGGAALEDGCGICDADPNNDCQQICGDGEVVGDEECDDGNPITENCAYGEEICDVCNASCQNVSKTGPYCGDGVTNGPEECDSGLSKLQFEDDDLKSENRILECHHDCTLPKDDGPGLKKTAER